LAALMYGSLFIAIGAACTDMKETQNLLWPVMLLACLPMFVLGNVLQEPNSAVATSLSFFPFATPMLMILRLSIPPGVAVWQPLLGVVLVLATTLLCVWAAGRIFRVGILMQGKGAKLGEMLHWVFRG
jgi:ABC-type Na+ efflux pump permease subunit